MLPKRTLKTKHSSKPILFKVCTARDSFVLLFELLGWSALTKLYPEILRLLLSEEMVQSRYVSLIQIKSYLNIELYASREVTLAQL